MESTKLTATEVVEITKKITGCTLKCKVDVWNEQCVACNRTIKQIKEAYDSTKTP
jgi:hypothetical protein